LVGGKRALFGQTAGVALPTKGDQAKNPKPEVVAARPTPYTTDNVSDKAEHVPLSVIKASAKRGRGEAFALPNKLRYALESLIPPQPNWASIGFQSGRSQASCSTDEF